MGNVGSHLATANLSIDDLEDIVYPTSRTYKTEVPEFVDPQINYELAERLGSLGQVKKPIDRLHDQIRFTQNEHAKLMLRKYIHRDVFTNTKFDRSVPLDLYFAEEYLVHRDCYSGRLNFARLYPSSKTTSTDNDDEHAMRAFNIFASRTRPELATSTTNSSFTTTTASTGATSTRPSLEDIQHNRPLVVAKKRRSKTDLHDIEGNTSSTALRRVPSDTCIPKNSEQLRRQRSKSADHGGRFKGRLAMFKAPQTSPSLSSEPAVPKLDGKFMPENPRLYLPPDEIDRSYSISPTKEFDFLLGTNSPPKPNRSHHQPPPQQLFSHRAQPQSEYRQYHGRAQYSPRLNNDDNNGFSKAEKQQRWCSNAPSVTEVGAASHWTLSDVAAEPAAPPPPPAAEGMINAGIPPRVPPHRAAAAAVSTISSHSRSAQQPVSGTVGYAGNNHSAMAMASVLSNAAGTAPDGAARGCENCATANSRPSSRQAIITTEPLKLDSNVYTRKCSFKKRASWVSQKMDDEDDEDDDDDDDDDDEAIARKLSNKHKFILNGYETKKKLHVVNRSSDRISVVSSNTEVPVSHHHRHHLSTASSRTQLTESAPQLDHDSATSEQDDDDDEWIDHSSLMQSPQLKMTTTLKSDTRPTAGSEFCHYFGLEMFSDKVVTRAQLRSSWETRGQRFLARYD